MNTFQTNPEERDLIVVGSGAGGKLIAWRSAQKGQRVVVVERKYVGGSCPNIACLPSKNIIHSAKAASFFYRSEEFGISKANVHISMSAVRERKRSMVRHLVDIHLDNYKKSGAELVMGTGRFVGPKIVEVDLASGGKRTFRGKNVVINTGTHATLEPIPGLAEVKPLTHIEALELDHIPKHLLVLGAGYVGLEFAQAFRRFGAEVTLIDRNRRLAHREDEDISMELEEMCRDEGITVVTNAKISLVRGGSGESVTLLGSRDGNELSLTGTHLLVAGGRTPNTSGIGLEAAGVELTDRGYVKVNPRLQTTAEGVWAVGDCAGSPQFTHISENDFMVVSANIAGGDRVTTGRQVPFCMFTDPELARIGLSETQAKERGIPYRLAKLPMAAVFRAMTISETRGFMKVLIEKEGDRILGFTMFGAGAGDVMSTVQMAMLAGLPYTALRDAVIAHPTMSEGLIALLFGGSRVKESLEPMLLWLGRAVVKQAMGKRRVGILFGGKSVEHEVSIQSARNVYEAIDQAKFDAVLIGIDKSGRWQIRDPARLRDAISPVAELEVTACGTALAFIPGEKCGSINEARSIQRLPQLDVVIPLLHGTFGEDGTVQGLLKLADVPFVGAGVLGSAIGMDKDVTKRLLREGGVPVAGFVCLTARTAAATTFEMLANQFGAPFFVKPANSGSSVGTNKVRTSADWLAARSEALRYDRKLLVEEFIRGQEIEVAVLGNDDPQASIPGEIVPRHDFYSYQAKYLDENGALLRIPADLSSEVTNQVRRLAVQAFRILECAGMARVDFFVADQGRIYVNEINTLPGFTKISMYPKLWEASGLPYRELIERLIDLAIERHRTEQEIETSFHPMPPP